MKLYYSPGACSLAPHILLHETGLSFTVEKVDLATHTTGNGDDYYRINPRGQVPLLTLQGGESLSEGPVIAQFIADQAGRADLAPTPGSMTRYRVMAWQNYVTAELHKSYTPLFNADLDAVAKNVLRSILRRKYEWLNEGALSQGEYLTGKDFTVADAYLFAVTRWAPSVSLNLKDLSQVQAYMRRIGDRPSVRAALAAEGLAA